MLPLSDSDLRRRRFPVVNVCLIVLCAVIFIYELTLGETNRVIFFYRFGLIPMELTQGRDLTALVAPDGRFDIATPLSNWATMFTSMFIHGDWLHFLSNMLYLWVFGDNVEDRLGHLGYLLFYFGVGLAAGWMQIAINTHSQVPLIGASGAIAGVLGAYFLLYPYNRIRTVVFFFFITFVRIPAVFLLGFWILLQFVSGLGSLGLAAQGGGVAYWAHIGGFVAGMAVVILYKLAVHEPLWRRRRV